MSPDTVVPVFAIIGMFATFMAVLGFVSIWSNLPVDK